MIGTAIIKETLYGKNALIEVIEIEKNEAIALKYCKFYNNQVPFDDRANISFKTFNFHIV